MSEEARQRAEAALARLDATLAAPRPEGEPWTLPELPPPSAPAHAPARKHAAPAYVSRATFHAMLGDLAGEIGKALTGINNRLVLRFREAERRAAEAERRLADLEARLATLEGRQ